MTSFALAIFLGAFLLFQVQPILGKYVLPWFGGGASTWTTCILFFQVMLLGGYAYAHALGARLSPRRQVQVHVPLLGASLLFLPLTPSGDVWRSGAVDSPATGILLLLMVQIGLPYLLLSATGPLLQSWFARTHPRRSPYRLYALSNLGSLLALATYPFVFEPVLALRAQGWIWTAGYAGYAALCALCARQLRLGAAAEQAELSAPSIPASGPTPAAGPRPAARTTALWLALAAAGSLMLMATTSLVCQDVTGMPLLWVLPLALYLGTFILCFDHERRYRRAVFLPLLAVGLVAVNLMLHGVLSPGSWWEIAVYCAVLFVACMVCHGELARSKPEPRHLTTFYLAVAGGGALGGVLSVSVAPVLFPDYWEYPLGLLAVAVLAVIGLARAAAPNPLLARRTATAGTLFCIFLAASLVSRTVTNLSRDVETVRNFYGVLHVRSGMDEFLRPRTTVVHGRTTHGSQFTAYGMQGVPTTYYGRESGIGVALDVLSTTARDPDAGLRIGVIGLGAGTIAALAKADDSVRFYEINPEVERIAREHFTFLADSPAEVQVLLGDGRLVLERNIERGDPEELDLLAVDAFNSDAVPMHLLTREALAVYAAHLKPETGVLAFHASNRHVDLLPVIRGLAEDSEMSCDVIVSPAEPQRTGTSGAVWVLLTRNRSFSSSPAVRLLAEPVDGSERSILWTDEFASLLPVLKPESTTVGHGGRFVIDSGALIEPQHEDPMLRQLRSLCCETRGEYPLMVVTIPAIPAGTGLSRYKKVLFRELGLARPGDHGVLLVVAVDERQISVELGDGWEAGRMDAVQRVLAATLIPGLQAGRPSRGIAAAVAELARMIREHAAGGDRAARPGPR